MSSVSHVSHVSQTTSPTSSLSPLTPLTPLTPQPPLSPPPPKHLPPASTRAPPKYSVFAEEVTFEARLKEATAKLLQYPKCVPVILEPSKNSKLVFEKRKFMVPQVSSVGQFIASIRERVPQLTPDQAIFLFIDNTLPCTSDSMGKLYQDYQASDRFLYIQYAPESTFGHLKS
jgi:GABA(A) receptor-associated protein